MNLNEIYEAAKRIADRETRRAFLEETFSHNAEALRDVEERLAREDPTSPSLAYASPDTATLSNSHFEESQTPPPQ